MKKNVIVGIGEILWDILPDGKTLGGAPANFAFHVSQFGFEGYAVSAIGNDNLGNEIITKLNDKSLKHLLERVDQPTGTVQVVIDYLGIPQYEISENVAWDNIPFTLNLKEIAKTTSAVSFGSLAQRGKVSQDTIYRFLELLPNDTLKVFDINLRQHFYSKEIIDKSLRKSNILKINDEEVEVVAGLYGWQNETEIEVCEKLLNLYNLQIVILTKGANGSYIINHENCLFQPTPKVDVVDTVGAGDAFTAGFIATLLKGGGLKEAHKVAVEISAFVCTQKGAMCVKPKKSFTI